MLEYEIFENLWSKRQIENSLFESELDFSKPGLLWQF